MSTLREAKAADQSTGEHISRSTGRPCSTSANGVRYLGSSAVILERIVRALKIKFVIVRNFRLCGEDFEEKLCQPVLELRRGRPYRHDIVGIDLDEGRIPGGGKLVSDTIDPVQRYA